MFKQIPLFFVPLTKVWTRKNKFNKMGKNFIKKTKLSLNNEEENKALKFF